MKQKLVFPDVSATGEIIYRLLQYMQVPITLDIAFVSTLPYLQIPEDSGIRIPQEILSEWQQNLLIKE